MPLLRSRLGSPMVGRTGGPMTNAPANVAAPAIVVAPSALAFNMNQPGTRCRGWGGSNNQFDNFGVARDWAYNFADTTNSFSGIRWQPTWQDVRGFYGTYQPAQGDVFRIQRKGVSGQDARTLVLTCGPNSAAIPPGDKVVLWVARGEGGPDPDTSVNLSGYNLPLKTKFTCVASTGSAWADPNGRRVIELDAGVSLPAIDYSPPIWSGGWYDRTQIQHRHWSFYADASTKTLRHPLGQFTDLSINSVLANNGYVMLGGIQWTPTYYDWSREWNLMGASLTEELWRMECQGLADYYGNTDPRYCAVELENEPVREYRDVGDGPGYGDLLPDVWYGIARQVWGQSRTIVVKATSFGGLNSLIDEFDFRCPTGENAHLVIHNYDNQIRGPNGIYGWTDIGQTDWISDQVKTKINSLGYRGGGSTELGVDAGRASGDADRGQRLGRLLTSFTRNDLYMFAWSMVGDAVRCSDIYSINGRNIESYWPGVRPYARRAGIMTT